MRKYVTELSVQSTKAFVDTNILVYAHDLAAGEKHARARSLVERLWDDRCGLTPEYPGRFNQSRQSD
jgi:hypothetical protein